MLASLRDALRALRAVVSSVARVSPRRVSARRAESLSFAGSKESNQRREPKTRLSGALDYRVRSLKLREPRGSTAVLFLFSQSALARVRFEPNGSSPTESSMQMFAQMCFQRLFFGDFLLARQKKVTRPPGRNPGAGSQPERNLQRREAHAQHQEVMPASRMRLNPIAPPPSMPATKRD